MNTCNKCGRCSPDVEFYKSRYDCKDCVKKQSREYHLANRERSLACKVERHKRNRESELARMRARYRLKRAEYIAYNAAYHRKNPGKNAEYKHRRRARKYGNGGSHTEAEWQDLLTRFGRCCARCLAPELAYGLSRDHIIPLSRGGTNDIGNIQPLCPSCNSSKGTRVVRYVPVF